MLLVSRRFALAGLAAAALAFTSACGQESTSSSSTAGSSAPTSKSTYTVGLVMKSLGNQYFQDMQKGAVDHAQQLGNVDLKPVGTQNETDIDGQVQEVQQFVSQKVDAIVIAPADSRALIAPLKQAVDAGIKVVNIDVKLDDATLKQQGLDIPFVGPDNVEGARQSGEAVAKTLPKGAKVIILEGNPGAANAEQRKEGFMKDVQQYGLTLVDSKTAHWETDEANTVVTNLLTKTPDIQAIFSSNDSMTLGAVKAVQAGGKSGKIKIASFDNIPAIQPLIKDGTVLSTLDQYGSQQAADGIDEALKALQGQSLTGWIKTPIKLITKDQLN